MSMGHNSGIAAEQLRSLVDRIERLETEKEEVSDQIKAVYAEGKANGFNPKAVKEIVKIRAMNPDEYREGQMILTIYKTALGMEEELPLFRQIGPAAADPTSRDSVIDALKQFVPIGGDIIVRMGGQPMRLWRATDGEVMMHPWIEPTPAKPDDAKPRSQRGAGKPTKPTKTTEALPDVDADGAQALGKEAAIEGKPVTSNPFPFGDPRRASFDAGWREQSGNDGMGPQ